MCQCCYIVSIDDIESVSCCSKPFSIVLIDIDIVYVYAREQIVSIVGTIVAGYFHLCVDRSGCCYLFRCDHDRTYVCSYPYIVILVLCYTAYIP